MVASSLDALQPVLLERFRCDRDLAASLRASANVPAIAGHYVEHRGHRLVDAAVFEPVPFRSAIADGCTHVLVLCTRPKRERRGVLPPLEVRGRAPASLPACLPGRRQLRRTQPGRWSACLVAPPLPAAAATPAERHLGGS